jgi:hypothetical protein
MDKNRQKNTMWPVAKPEPQPHQEPVEEDEPIEVILAQTSQASDLPQPDVAVQMAGNSVLTPVTDTPDTTTPTTPVPDKWGRFQVQNRTIFPAKMIFFDLLYTYTC